MLLLLRNSVELWNWAIEWEIGNGERRCRFVSLNCHGQLEWKINRRWYVDFRLGAGLNFKAALPVSRFITKLIWICPIFVFFVVFYRAINENIVLMSRAFRRQFVIPEFEEFTDKIDKFYYTCKAQEDSGKVTDPAPSRPIPPALNPD